MRKNLTIIGNSLGVIIERPILDILGFSRETELEVTTDGKRLIIERVTEKSRENRIRSLTKEVISSHEKTFRKLAE
ncbi:MAG: AbrB/MazE/SpoVT family DNA-binding domain-containing protein [Pyrinomonadaceae bacterium]